MKKNKKILATAAVAAALTAGGLTLGSCGKEATIHLTDLKPEEVRQIHVESVDSYNGGFVINFTEKEEIERFLNDWNTIVLEPVTEEEAKENGYGYNVCFMLSTGDTEMFMLGNNGIRKLRYGIYPGRIGLYDAYYRADLQDVYDCFFEYEKQDPNFDWEAYEKGLELEKIYKESQERMEKKRQQEEVESGE